MVVELSSQGSITYRQCIGIRIYVELNTSDLEFVATEPWFLPSKPLPQPGYIEGLRNDYDSGPEHTNARLMYMIPCRRIDRPGEYKVGFTAEVKVPELCENVCGHPRYRDSCCWGGHGNAAVQFGYALPTS